MSCLLEYRSSEEIFTQYSGVRPWELQVKQFNPTIHVYGHSHVNQSIELDGIHYVNNAFAYPSETYIARKQLKCIFEC